MGRDDGDSAEHTYWVELSNDGGDTWRTIAPRYTGTSLTIDNSIVGGGDDLRLRVRASDGANTGVAISEPFSMQSGRRRVRSSRRPAARRSPRATSSGCRRRSSTRRTGSWTAVAIAVVIEPRRALGTGASLHVYDLSIGTHTISMTATDSDGFELADSITVTVTSGGVFEGEPSALAGDVNCSGVVDSVDGLGISRHVAGLAGRRRSRARRSGRARRSVTGT